MKKILVPTDFSEFADMATELAILIAKKSEAEIHFVHLMDIPIDWISLVGDEQKKLYPDISAKVKSANNKLEALAKRAKDEGLKTKTLIEFNANYKYITEYTVMFNCDLIVMGSHGSSGIVDWFLGSNTQRVVRTSEVPVLTVKHTYRSAQFQEIVFVSDFDEEQLSAFRWLLDFAKDLETKIHLLLINRPSKFVETPIIEQKMQLFLDEGGEMISKKTVFDYYDFEEGLAAFTKEKNQLVALINHAGRDNVAERVINHLDFAVLSIRL